MTKRLHSVLLLWLICCLLSTPIVSYIIPPFNQWLSELLYAISYWVHGEEFTLSSDSVVQYTNSLFVLLIAIPIGFRVKENAGIQQALKWIVAFYLIKYGLEKVFQHQFYSIEPNIAYMDVKDMSKDLLFWTSMSTSYMYNTIAGMTEIIAGVLLLVPRFRLLGLLMSLVVAAYVFLLNLSFDITVKLLSGLLLLSVLVLLVPYFKYLRSVLIGGKSEMFPQFEIQQGSFSIWMKATLIVFLCIELIYPFLHLNQTEYKLQGAFQVVDGCASFDRLFIRSDQYIVMEQDGKFKSLNKMQSSRLRIDNSVYQLKVHDSVIMLQSVSDTIRLKELNYQTSTVFQDEFHWTVEGMKN